MLAAKPLLATVVAFNSGNLNGHDVLRSTTEYVKREIEKAREVIRTNGGNLQATEIGKIADRVGRVIVAVKNNLRAEELTERIDGIVRYAWDAFEKGDSVSEPIFFRLTMTKTVCEALRKGTHAPCKGMVA